MSMVSEKCLVIFKCLMNVGAFKIGTLINSGICFFGQVNDARRHVTHSSNGAVIMANVSASRNAVTG